MSEPGHSLPGAIALIVIGLLVLVPSGLCTGVVALGPLIEQMLHPRQGFNMAAPFFLALAIGGPFVLGGGLLLWNGIKKLRAWFKLRRDLADL